MTHDRHSLHWTCHCPPYSRIRYVHQGRIPPAFNTCGGATTRRLNCPSSRRALQSSRMFHAFRSSRWQDFDGSSVSRRSMSTSGASSTVRFLPMADLLLVGAPIMLPNCTSVKGGTPCRTSCRTAERRGSMGISGTSTKQVAHPMSYRDKRGSSYTFNNYSLLVRHFSQRVYATGDRFH